MASGVKLVFEFKDTSDKTVQYSYNYANPSATKAQVVAHAQSMIANTAVLGKTLASITSIKQIVTEESSYDLSDVAFRTPIPTEAINGNPEPKETTENQFVRTTKIG